MLTEGSTETPNGLAWKSRRGPRAGHVRPGVPQKLGRGCRFRRVIGLQGEPESEITHSACCAGEAEEKKIAQTVVRSGEGKPKPVRTSGRRRSD
jgi:hypothetical protein